MTNIAPLDRVIRHVNKDAVPTGPSEKIICIDAQSRRILDATPWWFLGGDRRYYLVANSSDPRNFAQDQLSGYTLQNLDYQLPVMMTYTVACRPGNGARAVLALFDPARSLREVFDSWLTRWIVDIGQSDIPAFVTRCLQDRESIERDVASRAFADTGLDLTVRLSLDWEMTLPIIHVNRDHLRVLVSDFQDKEQDLSVHITVEVDEHRKREAILYYRRSQQVIDRVVGEILAFFRANVSMQMFVTELGSAGLRARLAECLDRVVAPYGRRVGPITLTGEGGNPVFFEGEHTVTCKLHEYPKPVDVRCKVQMIRTNEALYRAAKTPELTEWLTKQLERCIRQILFDARYIDVLTRFPRYEKAIRSTLEREAAAIGYSIDQLITGPDLEPLRWVHPFTMEIDSTPFETRLSRFYVNLQFAVTARISQLDSEKIRKYLNRDQNIPNLMRDAIVAQTRRVLHGIEPERFYMRFNFSDVPDETPVEETLVSAIRTRLETDFDSEVFEVVIKVAETDLIARLRKLMETFCPFVVEMKSLHGRETLVFRGNFQIDSVAPEGWHRFQLLTIGIDEIRKLLEEHLLAELNALTPNEMQYRDPRHRKTLEAIFVGLAERFVREQFGLVIRMTSIRRDPTPHELNANRKLLGDDQRRIEVESDQREQWAASAILENRERAQRISQLLERKRLLILDAANKEEIELIDRQIAIETAALKPAGIPTFDAVKDKVLPETGDGATLLDVARLAGLNIDGSQKQLSDGDKE